MKIVHLSSERGWRGGEAQLELLFRSLAHACEQKVVVPKQSELSHRVPESALITVKRLGWTAPEGFLDTLRLVRRWRPDILHAHTSKALETALLLKAVTATPVVASKRNAFHVRGGWKYRRADTMIAVSQAARSKLLEADVEADRLCVIHDAVDQVRFEATARSNVDGIPLVLCAAAFSLEKGLDTLLAAWRIVESEGTHGKLLLVGRGNLETLLHAQKTELGLKRFEILGWREDVPQLLAEADIATLASREEGLSSFLCEAQWMGKPAVATNAGGIPEVVLDGTTGLLGPVGDAEALARNLSKLLRDRDLREKMGAAARRRARAMFDIQKIGAQHMEAYQALIA